VSKQRRCLIIDEHPTVRLGVRRLLAGRYEVEEAADGAEALEVITSLGEFDVAIVELGTPGSGDRPSGIAAVRTLRKARPGLGIVAHDRRPHPYSANRALDAGATAYAAKSSPCERLEAAIDAAADSEAYVDSDARQRNGNRGLTRRQRETLQHFADGRSTSEVAERLGVTTETVRTHTKAVLSRLSARDRAHAVAIGLRASLIE
jgi:DNA-binding NarL/FixJ family response regulator